MRQLPYLQMGLKVKCHTIKDTPDLNRDSQYEPVMIRTRDSVLAPQSSHACIVATLHVLTPASSPPKKSGVITFSYIQSSDTGWLLVRDTCALSDDIVRMPPVCNVPEWRWRVIINPWHWHGRVDCGLWTGVCRNDHNLGRRSEYIHMVIAIITDSEQELEQISGHLMIVGWSESLLFWSGITTCGFMTGLNLLTDNSKGDNRNQNTRQIGSSLSNGLSVASFSTSIGVFLKSWSV